ncbi:hypothetical protein TNIN_77431 [Trichonephila inaurata madagascariensis]|uniref:Transposase n=1 Tax=Trichonephila inaurata madagascariensis TaxID=2747483 RepID=A0A8X6IXJ7_9ARAC|nr:hypothetical protein TNIN_77431 [Trichonephila inaurata madagascariensis]
MCCVNSRSNQRRARGISTATNVNHKTIRRVLGAEILRPYHAQREWALKATDHQPRVDFSPMVPPTTGCATRLSAHVIFTDECSFSQEGIFNAHS